MFKEIDVHRVITLVCAVHRRMVRIPILIWYWITQTLLVPTHLKQISIPLRHGCGWVASKSRRCSRIVTVPGGTCHAGPGIGFIRAISLTNDNIGGKVL